MPEIHPQRIGWDRFIGLLIMLILHVIVLYSLWSYRLIPAPTEAVTLFVNFITPPAPPKLEEPPKPVPPREVKISPPRPIEQPRQLVVEAPVTLPSEPVALPPPPPPPPAEPVVEAPPSAGPVMLSNELSVSCPERSPPIYPLYSQRIGEQGHVVLRVELDEQGRVSAAHVVTSSGSTRLDEAAMSAVVKWRCTPAQRDGVTVRAVALQPFNFILKGR